MCRVVSSDLLRYTYLDCLGQLSSRNAISYLHVHTCTHSIDKAPHSSAADLYRAALQCSDETTRHTATGYSAHCYRIRARTRHTATRTFKYGIAIIPSAECTLSTDAHSLFQSDCTVRSHRDFSVHQVPVTSAHLRGVPRSSSKLFAIYRI